MESTLSVRLHMSPAGTLRHVCRQPVRYVCITCIMTYPCKHATTCQNCAGIDSGPVPTRYGIFAALKRKSRQVDDIFIIAYPRCYHFDNTRRIR